MEKGNIILGLTAAILMISCGEEKISENKISESKNSINIKTIISGNPIFKLVIIDDVFVRVSVPENEINKIKKSQSAQINIPVIWWGDILIKSKKHKVMVSIAKNNLQGKSVLILLQIDKLCEDLCESYKQIPVAKSYSIQAKEHLNVIRDNYDAGIVNTSDLLEAQAIYKIKKAYYLQAIAKHQ